MRKVVQDFGTIVFPEFVAFAFNPTKIRVELLTDGEVKFDIGRKYTDVRESYANVVEIDIHKYLQTFVNKDSRFNEIQCGVIVGNLSYYFDLYVIWGAINVGETFNSSRTVTWYKNLPFTFEMFIPVGATIQTRYDNTGYSTLDLGSGVVKITPNDMFSNANKMGVIRLGSDAGGVFDFTFDGSFGSVKVDVLNKLIVDECTEGVYLRWIDRHGFCNYHLFHEGENTQTDKALDKIANVYEASYQYDASIFAGKEAEKTIKLGAPLVDDDAFWKLSMLCTSPVVEMYVGNDTWVPVSIAPMSIVKGTKPLNDMEFVLTLPTIMTQRL